MSMRIFISTLALSLGLTTGALAAGSYGVQATVLDPGALDKATTELLSDKTDSHAVVNQLDQIMGVAINAGTAANGDPAFAASVADKRAKVRAAAESALNDPQLRDAVRNAVSSLQQQMSALSNGSVTVQGTSVSAAAREQLAKQDPALAAALPKNLDALTISADQTKTAQPQSWLRTLQRMTGQLALIAAGLVVLALVFSPNRAQILRRIGRWGMVAGGLPVLLFAVLPQYVLPHLGSIGGTVAAFLHGSATALIGPAWVLALGGLLLFVAAGTVTKRNAMLRLIPAQR